MRTGAAAGLSEPQVLAAIAQERNALAAALDSHDVRHALATGYLQAHSNLAPNLAVSLEKVHQQTDGVVANRVADARALARLVTQEDFITEVHRALQQPANASENYQLPPEKIEEMVARFDHHPPSYPQDAAIHIAQEMEGQRIGHLALAQAFAADGPLCATLRAKLAGLLPAEDASRLASDWVEARRKPALATADALAESGAVYVRVMQQFGSGHMHSLPASMPAAPAPAPAPASAPAAATIPAPASGSVASPLAAQKQALLATSALTAQQIEHNKDALEKASEWAYTINHAISCGLTDVFIQPYVGKWVTDAIHYDRLPPGLHWLHRIFEKHDHGDHHDHHDHSNGACAHHPHEKLTLGNNLSHWMGAEFVSDVVAVPLTVMTQRFFPSFMHGIRSALEPVAGGLFRRGAERDARHWARRQTEPVSAEQVVQKAQELYNYEMDHLPQAAMWNAFSVPINVISQKALGNRLDWRTILIGKTFGSLVSNGMLIGGRALAPDAFHHWDRWSSKNVVNPTTKIVGKLFGIGGDTVDKVAAERARMEQGMGWQGRVSEVPPTLEVAR